MMARNAVRTRPGLTLMELVVVLMVLVALAGILIPMLPSMLTRAHVATHTTNVTELTKLLLTYQATHPGFPDQWDAMTDGTTLINYMAGGVLLPGGGGSTTTMGGGVFVAQAPTTGPGSELSALNSAGIFSVHYQVADATSAPTGFDPTFNNYLTPVTYTNGKAVGTPITGTTKLAYLGGPNWAAFQAANYPGWSSTANYVALGIGSRSTMIGTSAVTAPVHFSDTPDASPELSYARFIAIFKVSDPNAPGGVNMAQLVGVAAIHGTGPNSLDSEFQNWYQINNGGS